MPIVIYKNENLILILIKLNISSTPLSLLRSDQNERGELEHAAVSARERMGARSDQAQAFRQQKLDLERVHSELQQPSVESRRGAGDRSAPRVAEADGAMCAREQERGRADPLRRRPNQAVLPNARQLQDVFVQGELLVREFGRAQTKARHELHFLPFVPAVRSESYEEQRAGGGGGCE